MSIKDQLPVNRTSITMVVVVVLCAVGFAYGQGWFNRSSSGYETESNKVGTDQTIGQEKANEDAVQVTQTVSEPVATPTK
jgi:hypothetical protein